MKKRPGFKAMVINSEDDSGAGEVMKSSLSVTAGGSLQVRLPPSSWDLAEIEQPPETVEEPCCALHPTLTLEHGEGERGPLSYTVEPPSSLSRR